MRTPTLQKRRSIGLEPAAHRLEAGDYLTDERNLFRCLSVDNSPLPDTMSLLEDCRTLEVLILPTADLAGAQLRFVCEQSSDC